jgi:serine/threonine protein kinase
MTMTQPGRVIAGRYRLLTPVGSGGAGVVWRARDELLDRDVAVKEISRLLGGTPPAAGEDAWAESYQRTLREARAAARISHPGVAAVYDVVASPDDGLCIVMELIGGSPLSQLVQDGPALTPAEVTGMGRQVLDALMAGHAAGVLHRDLKPANVLITPAGRAVLTDFGIAIMTGDPSITRTGIVLGTPGYTAPERVRGEPATPAADLWSLGATLYAAACGQGPYDGYDGVMATMYAIATEDPPAPTVGGRLGELIGALLIRDAALRPTAREAAEALAAAADELESLATAPPPAPLPAPPVTLAPRDTRPTPTPTVDSELLAPPEPANGMVGATTPSGGGGWRNDPLPPARSQSAKPDPLPPARSEPAKPDRRPSSGRPSRRRPSRGVLTGGLAALGAAAATVLVVAALNQGSPAKAGSTAFGTNAASVPPAVAEQFRVAAALNADNSPELLAVAKNGGLAADHFAGGAWQGWQQLPGGTVFAGVPAAALAKDGRLMVFARTTSGLTDYFYQASPNSAAWNGPVQLGDRQITSAPAVIAWPDGHLQVFARLPDGTLGQASQLSASSETGWSHWSSLSGHLAGPPVVALDDTGHPQVFALGPDGGLGVDAYANGQWQGWRALPGGKAYTGMPSVGMNQDGRLEVFARTASGTIDHVWQDPGNQAHWGGPLALFENAASDPGVFNTKGGRMEVFVQAPDGTIEHSWQFQPVAGTGWAHPQSLQGSSDGAPVPIWVGTESELFTRTPSGAIQWDHLVDEQAGWTGWSGLGGSF